VVALSPTGGYTVLRVGILSPYGTAPSLSYSAYYSGQNVINGAIFSST
jgi:hypothetical protein